MTETAGNRHNGNVGGYHQAGVGVAQAVNRDRREIVRPQETRKLRCYFVQVKRCAIPASKQQVVLYCFAVLHLHSTRPR